MIVFLLKRLARGLLTIFLVVAFAFAVGEAIPAEIWEDHGLNAFDTH